jgi:UDP-N-acetylglucosamine--N-acetylmuramyl-(pentapeptide) pyrophosphoryl-undecaprenol N-acetylglucosamine transferase
VGGSQGAHRINLAVMDCLTKLGPQSDFYFIHQTGTDDEIAVTAAYRRQNMAATVQAFFNDMDHQYARADLIICRAGATTVAELTVIGKGVIFIPYPFAADNHQVFNARPLVDLGAAEMILEKDLTGDGLAERIAYYAARPEALTSMAKRARRLGRPAAAQAIVDDCYTLLAASRQ